MSFTNRNSLTEEPYYTEVPVKISHPKLLRQFTKNLSYFFSETQRTQNV